MKKLLTVVLILALLLPAAAFAEEDNEFMGLSYIELMRELGKVQRALWACDEYKSAEVQAGVYKIGEDIPAGKWEINASAYDDFYSIGYGTRLTITGADIETDSLIGWWNISSDYSDSLMHSLIITLEDGYYLQLGHKSKFTPYSGHSTPKFNFE